MSCVSNMYSTLVAPLRGKWLSAATLPNISDAKTTACRRLLSSGTEALSESGKPCRGPNKRSGKESSYCLPSVSNARAERWTLSRLTESQSSKESNASAHVRFCIEGNCVASRWIHSKGPSVFLFFFFF